MRLKDRRFRAKSAFRFFLDIYSQVVFIKRWVNLFGDSEGYPKQKYFLSKNADYPTHIWRWWCLSSPQLFFLGVCIPFTALLNAKPPLCFDLRFKMVASIFRVLFLVTVAIAVTQSFSLMDLPKVFQLLQSGKRVNQI